MPNISQTPYRGTGQVYNYKTIERNSRDEARKVLPHVRTKGTAIDVGAHVGTWAVHLAPAFKRVVCIEPVIENCVDLRERFADCPHVEIIEAACSDVNEEGAIAVISPSRMGGTGPVIAKITSEGHDHYRQTVRYARLDDLIPEDEPVDLLKIDADGMDCQVLRGAERILRHERPVVFVEVKYFREQIRDYLLSVNYARFDKIRPNEIWTARDWRAGTVVV